MTSSRRSSQPRDQTQVSHIAGGFFTSRTTKEDQEASSLGIIHSWKSVTQFTLKKKKKKGGFSHSLHRKKVQKDSEKERRVRIRAEA